MDAARLSRIQTLFHSAADLPSAAQGPFLSAACGEDGELAAEVLGMLEADAQGAPLLDDGVAGLAQRLFGAATAGPREIGPYRLGKILGEGGMGVVFLAEREDLGNRVAIKFLRDAWLSSSRRARFAEEQRTLAQLNHPSIARLYDADTLPDGTPWFAMEFVDGAPITAYCRTNESPLAERLRLFRDVCEAVRYAHANAVIHRDLKPSNIFVKPDGSVRLLDFGIARHLDNLDRPADSTRTAVRLMTPAYAAPEQILGAPIGVFTDVYSLGVVLYELLTGRLPLDLSNRTPGEAERMIVAQDAAKPSSVAASPPFALSKSGWADLDVLCLTAIHKDPARRYRSVEALIRDVDHYVRHEPLEARLDTVRYRCGKFVRRNRRPIYASLLVLVTIVALVAFFTVRLTAARNATLAAAARTQRVQRFMLNLFEGGDSSAAPSDGLRVVTLIDRGVREAQSLQRDPEERAEIYQTLGDIYRKLGDPDRADPLLSAALKQRRSLFGPGDPAVAESLVALGLLRVDQARLDEAERLVREALAKTSQARPRDIGAVAKATAALGKVLEARGAYSKAIPVLQEAIRLQSGMESAAPDLAASFKELADTQFYAGNYDACDALSRRAMSLHRQLFGDHHPLVAADLVNLGAVRYERGDYSEAERLYRQALAIDTSWFGADNPETASNLTMLGRALIRENRFDEAVNLLERALAIQERSYGPLSPRVAGVLNELASVALQRGRLKEAESQFRRMSDIYKAAYGERHYLYALSLSNLASVYLDRKDYARAERIYRDVIARFTAALSEDHLYTGIAQIKLGRALVRQKRYAEAEEHSLAGYRILTKQTSPSVTWLKSARQDLATIYDALSQPDKAANFRTELAETLAP